MVKTEIQGEDVMVVIMDFRETQVHECVTLNDDGTYTIFLNARDTFERQQKSFLHALEHIIHDDFHNEEMSADEIERIRHS